MTSDQIVEASNHEYHRRVSNMWGRDPKPSDDPADVPERSTRTRSSSPNRSGPRGGGPPGRRYALGLPSRRMTLGQVSLALCR